MLKRGLLLDKMADIAINAVKHFAAIGADGIFSCDDWGLQDRPMVSPAIFRDFFKPRYAKVYRYAQECGMLTFLHSCGYIIDLLEDFIKELSRRFGGRLCFWCPVDIQQTMVKGTLEDIRAYARGLIESFGKFNGGFIAKWYPSPDAVGHSQERIKVMSEAFVEYGGKNSS